ncbi:MAG: recombinase family protein [Ruminococcus sp.]|nr:recombinase family protein [Ruminococcus sp.]
MAKQTIYNAGIYVRLSQEDMRAGESLSIEHQILILTKYVREHGWNLVDTYVDDGYSGTDFNRPSVQRLLSDAQTGRINLIICKDLSRFGRNYIEVGQYIDYIFPLHNIRFIALNDNVDTANRDSNAMEMMPVINLFNEWHASSTSKKIKAVNLANAKAGKYTCANAAYGYTKADDEKHTPIIDPEAAEVVRRIFKLRSQGMSPRAIGDQLNAENIPIPSDYRCQKKGIVNTKYTRHLWTQVQIRQILDNPIYLGKLAMMRVTSVSYKNHKKVRKDPTEWIVTEGTHEAIISQELWDKVREAEKAVSHGKRDGKGVTQPLSGMLFCPDCGYKMKAAGRKRTLKSGELIRECYYNCSSYVLHGKGLCSTHYISQKQIEAVIIADIRSMAELVVKDEQTARAAFLSKKEQQTSRQSKADIKKLNDSKHRLAELENLMQSVYEDKVMGKIPEHICVNFLQKYEAEQQELRAVIADLEERLSAEKQDREDVEEFIRRLKKYVDVQTLTRELCLELIEYVTVGAYTPNEPREINIYYKFLDKPLADKKTLYSDENT